MMLFKTKSTKARRGLTLTELAMVLGISGIVMGAIWAVVSVVWTNYQAYRTTQQVTTVVQNIRDYYGPMGKIKTPAGAACTSGNDITADIDDDDRRLIPIEMRITPTTERQGINHALATTGVTAAQGSFQVQCEDNGNRFRAILLGLRQDHCIKMLMEFPMLLPEIGVTAYAVNSGTDETVNTALGVTNTLTISAAEALCTLINDNRLDIVFKLRN